MFDARAAEQGNDGERGCAHHRTSNPAWTARRVPGPNNGELALARSTIEPEAMQALLAIDRAKASDDTAIAGNAAIVALNAPPRQRIVCLSGMNRRAARLRVGGPADGRP